MSRLTSGKAQALEMPPLVPVRKLEMPMRFPKAVRLDGSDPRIPWRWRKGDARYERRLSAAARPVVARPREGRQTRRSSARPTRRTGSKSPPGESGDDEPARGRRQGV